MRTTVTIDDQLYRELKSRAGASGRTVGDLIEDAVRDSFRATERSGERPIRPLPVSGSGGPLPGVDLTDNASLRELLDEGIPLLERR
jgi:hypothetical protein